MTAPSPVSAAAPRPAAAAPKARTVGTARQIMDLEALRAGLMAMVGDPAQPDLSVRQVVVLLNTHLDGQQTVRGLADRLNTNKPSMTRALDRLGAERLTKRHPDPKDKRNVFGRIEPAGEELLLTVASAMAEAR